MSTPTLTPEDKLNYVLTVLKHTELAQPHWLAAAIELAENNADDAQGKFTAILEGAGFALVNGQVVAAGDDFAFDPPSDTPGATTVGATPASGVASSPAAASVSTTPSKVPRKKKGIATPVKKDKYAKAPTPASTAAPSVSRYGRIGAGERNKRDIDDLYELFGTASEEDGKDDGGGKTKKQKKSD